jgi:DNA primase
MGLFDKDIANSSKVSAEDKAKYKAASEKADAKEEARYKSGPDREEMARKRKIEAMRKKRDKEEQPSHRWKPKPSESAKGSSKKSSMDDLLKLMPIDTLEERIRKTYGPDAPKRTGAGGEELPLV